MKRPDLDGVCARPLGRLCERRALRLCPGDLESAPVLRSVSSDGCLYEFEWYTAAACVLARAAGDDCKVEDPQAGQSHTHISHNVRVPLKQTPKRKEGKDLFVSRPLPTSLPRPLQVSPST